MYDEHCNASDANLVFIASNYGTRTTSHIEYYFVADPNNGLDILTKRGADAGLGLDDWPRPKKHSSSTSSGR